MALLGGNSEAIESDPSTAGDQAGLTAEWSRWMSEPSNRAAMLQMGMQLMQPIAVGQSNAGHFAQALGGGGEAAARVQQQQRLDDEIGRKQLDTESKAQLRADQAEVGYQRAETLRGREETRLQQVNLQRQQLAMREQQLIANIQNQQQKLELAKRRLDMDQNNSQFKNEYAQAQADLARANSELSRMRTELAPVETAIRGQRAQTDQTRQQTEARQGDIRLEQGAERNRINQQRVNQQGAMNRARIDTENAKLYERYQTITPRSKQLTRPQWQQQFGINPPNFPASQIDEGAVVEDRQGRQWQNVNGEWELVGGRPTDG